MREGWKYCKLGEICKLYQPKTISSELLCSDGKYFVYGANGVIGRYNQYNHENAEVLMTCRGATCGTINLSKPFSWINGNAMVVHPKFEYTFYSNEFLVYLLKSIDLSCVITGCAQPQITVQSLSPLLIPVPPIEEQQRIVTELDLLSSIIEKQKAQLKELDTLAQSIFYDMFGDPVTNEKGWKTELMCIIAPSSEYRGEHTDIDGKYWLLNLDKVESMTGRVTEKEYFDYKDIGSSTISFDTTNVLYSKLRPYLNKVVLPNETGYATSELIPLKPNKELLDRCYFANMLRSNEFMTFIKDKVAGAKMPRVSMSDFKKFLVPLPPLSLQQQFADKIQSIESQKSAITKSIAETQKLFDYTMDKYFG